MAISYQPFIARPMELSQRRSRRLSRRARFG
jgi:hypothetical protein